jgi:hypothetical protein
MNTAYPCFLEIAYFVGNPDASHLMISVNKTNGVTVDWNQIEPYMISHTHSFRTPPQVVDDTTIESMLTGALRF